MTMLFDASAIIFAIVGIGGAVVLAIIAGALSARLFLDATREPDKER